MNQFQRSASSLAALAFATIGGPAWAQDSSETDSDEAGIQDIIVTAEKRATSVQATPIAISAFNQDLLDSKGIQDVTALQSQVPSLKFTVPQGVVQITMRGAGNDAVTSGADSGVGFYFDGVYVGNPAGSLADIWDVERVEVLRGPQGTLYGRNTTGGAINVIPAKPSDAFEAKGDIAYGSYDMLRLRAALNIPLGEHAASRFDVTRTRHDGYQKNTNPNGTNGDSLDLWTARGALSFDLGDGLKLNIMGTYAQNDDSSASSPVRVGGYPTGGPANLISTIYSTVPPRSTDPRVTNKNLPELTRLRFYGGSGALEWDFGSATLRSTTAYYRTKRATESDWDDSPLDFISIFTSDKGNQFSQELTLLSNPGGSLDWIVGAYYYNLNNDRVVDLGLGEIDGNRPGPFFGSDLYFAEADHQKIRSRALYAQFTYHLSDALRLTGGLRYTWDRKSSVTTMHPPVIGHSIPPPNFFISFPIKDKWREPTGKLSIDYDISRSNMLYATYSHGYKAGAINPEDPFNPSTKKELVDSFEVGLKNYFLDRKVMFNIAGFYADYSNVQILTFPVVNPVLINIPGGKAKGVEIDFAIEPSSFFRIDGSAGYVDSNYKHFVTGNPAVPTGPESLRQDDIGGNMLTNTPKFSLALGAEFKVPAFGGEVKLRGDLSYRSSIHFDAFANPDMQQKGNTKSDLRIGWTDANERFNVQAFVLNIENHDVRTTMLRPGGIAGSDVPIAWYAPPRTWGVSLGFSY